jgi:hypothetical protein
MLREDFEALRRAEREFNRAYRAELIRQLKATVASRPEGYAPSDQELEAGLPENIAKAVRLSGNLSLADRYLAAWELAVEAGRTSRALTSHSPTARVICGTTRATRERRRGSSSSG